MSKRLLDQANSFQVYPILKSLPFKSTSFEVNEKIELICKRIGFDFHLKQGKKNLRNFYYFVFQMELKLN
jgi:hypothetical protein